MKKINLIVSLLVALVSFTFSCSTSVSSSFPIIKKNNTENIVRIIISQENNTSKNIVEKEEISPKVVLKNETIIIKKGYPIYNKTPTCKILFPQNAQVLKAKKVGTNYVVTLEYTSDDENVGDTLNQDLYISDKEEGILNNKAVYKNTKSSSKNIFDFVIQAKNEEQAFYAVLKVFDDYNLECIDKIIFFVEPLDVSK